jgi:hypothetical protein
MPSLAEAEPAIKEERKMTHRSLSSALRAAAAAVVGAGMLASLASSAHAYVLSGCGQWIKWTDPTGYYTVFNDEWGSNVPNSQCLYVTNWDQWFVVANDTGTGVKGFPDTSFNIGKGPTAISSLHQCTATYNFTAPADATYDWAFDIWSGGSGHSDEIMIWESWAGSVGPIAATYGCAGYPATACPIATNVSIGGSTWNVYRGNFGHNTVSFLNTTMRSSGTEDILAIMQYCQAQGLLAKNTISQVQFGPEITATNGAETFALNTYGTTTN